LGRAMRYPVILPGAGALSEIKDKPKGVNVNFTMHASPQTFDDKNGNFKFDPPAEVKKAWDLAAAVTKKGAEAKAPAKDNEGRAVVVGDSDAISDLAISSYGNPYLVVDGLKWLLGDEAFAGETQSEVDQPIVHTRDQDKWWFYSTIFVAP